MGVAPMTIAKVECIYTKPAWVFVKITTDNGIVGWGEASYGGRDLATGAAVMEAARYLVGTDPTELERHWSHLFRGPFRRGGPVLMSASAGIDMALWDIKGKAYGVPIYQLIGGKVREKVRAYGGGATPEWCNAGQPGAKMSAEELVPFLETWDADEWAASLPDWSPEIGCPTWGGFTCHKVCYLPACMLGGVERPIVINQCANAFAALRRKVGSSVDIAMDLHGRASPATARQLVAKLAPSDPMFIEEPILGDDLQSLLHLQQISTVPIATGERVYTRWQWGDLIANSACQIVQPDIITSGGIWELRKIAAMAEAREIGIAPHMPYGPISFMACIHLAAATPNHVIQEGGGNVTASHSYLTEPIELLPGGFIGVPNRPG